MKILNYKDTRAGIMPNAKHDFSSGKEPGGGDTVQLSSDHELS